MWLSRIAGKLGLMMDASPFVPLDDADWNNDSAVLHHELGHCLVWFHHGGGIGRLRLARARDRLLEASVRTGPRPGQIETPAFVDAAAERLLAGEIAGRRYLGLPSGRISLRHLKEHRLPAGVRPEEIAKTFAEVDYAPDGTAMHGDAAKVLSLAAEHHRANWRQWIKARLVAAETLVLSQWTVLDSVAKALGPHLPDNRGEELIISASDLITAFRAAGAKAHGDGPVAV